MEYTAHICLQTVFHNNQVSLRDMKSLQKNSKKKKALQETHLRIILQRLCYVQN